MNSEKLIQHINPPKYLAALISYTLASDILHIFEKERPNDLRPRKVLELIKRHLDGEEIGEVRLMNAAYAANDAADDVYAAYSADAAAATNAADAAAAAANVVYIADITDVTYFASEATSEEHVIKLIYSLMPQTIDYAIKNQEKLFTGPGDFSEVFDKLDDVTREKVIWNMDLFG